MGEILCVVNENDKLIRSEKREIIHNSKLWHRGVHVFIENEKGEIPLQERSAKKDKYPLALDCSISEHVRYGEGYEICAKRGLKEELDIKEVYLKECAHFRMKYGEYDYMICKLFYCKYDGEIKINKEEINEIIYFTKYELKRRLEKNDEKFAPWTRELLKLFFGMPNKLISINKRY